MIRFDVSDLSNVFMKDPLHSKRIWILKTSPVISLLECTAGDILLFLLIFGCTLFFLKVLFRSNWDSTDADFVFNIQRLWDATIR